jgi:hypothetical protein
MLDFRWENNKGNANEAACDNRKMASIDFIA